MKNQKVEAIDEARTWGRSLILSGALVILVVATSTNDWTDSIFIIWIGIAVICAGWCLCRFSDKPSDQSLDS
jgi:general stress protein CsbA